MTTNLENLLNLPEAKNMVEEAKRTITGKKVKAAGEKKTEDKPKKLPDLQKIDLSLPEVRGLGDAADKEFDALAQRATDAYDDLMDLGMNVDPRYASRMFEIASTMLKNAIEAKNLKIEKKLKIIDLQLKKVKLEQEPAQSRIAAKKVVEEQKPQTQETKGEGEGYIVSDRNSLLEKLRNLPPEDK